MPIPQPNQSAKVDRPGRDERAVTALRSGGRILVTRLAYLGDVVLSLPVVDALRDAFPKAEIDYLCKAPASALLAEDARFAVVHAMPGSPSLADSVKLVKDLRARNYTITIDLYSNPRSAWLCRLSGARMRIGGDRRGRRHLYTHPVRVPGTVRSAVSHHLAYLAPLGVDGAARRPVLSVAPPATERARAVIADCGLDPGAPLALIHPGGKWPVKRWPEDRFAALAGLAAQELGAQVAVLTGPGEATYTNAVVRMASGAVALPALDTATVAALLAQADGVVACDGGIAHVSVAVGAPTVAIFGSAEPDIWFPYESYGRYEPAFVPMSCRPCHKHECPLGHTDCLNTLTPEMVMSHLRRVWRRSTAGQTGAVSNRRAD